jgi:hypothetical protein
LSPHYRRRALGKLDAMIAGVERERSERLQAVARMTAAKKSGRGQG